MTALVVSCALYFSAQASLAAGEGSGWTVEPELAPFAEQLRKVVLAHDVAGIVRLMEPSGLQCQPAPKLLSAVEAELKTPGSFWHSFFFDSQTLTAKFSEAGEKRFALEEIFKNGKEIEVRRQENRIEFVSSNYDTYPRLYLKQSPKGWLIACDPKCGDC